MACFENGLALVVGVGAYVGEGFPDMPETALRALELAGLLQDPDRCGYASGSITLLTGRGATRYRIGRELEQLSARANPDSTIFFYFAGHVGHQSEGRTYLCPRGADVYDLEHTAVSLDVVVDILKKIQARGILVVLDFGPAAGKPGLGFNGTSNSGWNIGLNDEELRRLGSEDGLVVLTSSETGTPSLGNASISESSLTHHLIAALNGALPPPRQDHIGVLDLFSYVTSKVSQHQPGQRPLLHAGDRDGNFPVALYLGGQKGAGPSPEPAVVGTPPTITTRIENHNSTTGNQIVGNGNATVNNQGVPLEALRELLKATAAEKSQRTRRLDRRVEAAIPAQMRVGKESLLFVQVRLPEAPPLSPDDWPRAVRPEKLEAATENVRLDFPTKPRSQELGDVELLVRLSGESFSIPSPERHIFVPPDDNSQRIHFLITPKREGGALLSIDILTVDQRSIASLPLGTDVVGDEIKTAHYKIANLMLNVSIAPASRIELSLAPPNALYAPAYLNVNLAIERRGDKLLALMTMLQKDGQSFAQLSKPTAITLDLDRLRAVKLDMEAYSRLLTSEVFASEELRGGWLRARAYADGSNCGLRLHLALDTEDEDLHGVCWESLLAPDTNTPLALDESVLLARILPSDSLVTINRPQKSDLHATLVVAAPSDLSAYSLSPIDVVAEVQRARAAFGHTLETIVARHTEATIPTVTVPSICDGLRSAPHVLYLLAHGQIQDKEPFLCLEDDKGCANWVSGRVFVQHLTGFKQRPLLIILGSCQSAGDNNKYFLKSLGAQFARAGIPAVVSFQGNVSQHTLERLLPPFVREVQRDGRVDRALAAARKHVSSDVWWQIILWLRTYDGSIWEAT